MGFKLVNPFSKLCSQGWSIGEHSCTLTSSNTYLNAIIYVKTDCHYRCTNPDHSHTVTRTRVIFFLEWFSDEE